MPDLLQALAIPAIFLLFLALVVSVSDWYSDRQQEVRRPFDWSHD
jgi:P2-related tail formation protein